MTLNYATWACLHRRCSTNTDVWLLVMSSLATMLLLILWFYFFEKKKTDTQKVMKRCYEFQSNHIIKLMLKISSYWLLWLAKKKKKKPSSNGFHLHFCVLKIKLLQWFYTQIQRYRIFYMRLCKNKEFEHYLMSEKYHVCAKQFADRKSNSYNTCHYLSFTVHSLLFDCKLCWALQSFIKYCFKT